MEITVPELSLVVLIGASGSGKSTFAARHFKPTEVLSSDRCRGLVADDENDQSATAAAFEVLHLIAARRLAAGRLTVIDATSVQAEARKSLVALARAHHVLPVAIVFDVGEDLCHERNRARPDRSFGPQVVRNQYKDLRRSLKRLKTEGFRHIHVFGSAAAAETALVRRQPLWNNRRDEHGPFDIIGDVHGCLDELIELIQTLGYGLTRQDDAFAVTAPPGRRLVFVGDLVDRGPDSAGVLRLAMDAVQSGAAICVPGNHESKLLRHLRGKAVKLSHGLERTVAQLEAQPQAFRDRVAGFIDNLVSHYVFDEGRLVVAHAGMKEAFQGRGSGAVRAFALYGETTGETDDFGLPVRYNWAADYRGKAMVVYGHTPVLEPQWLNNTLCIDTGCVFGGKLTALRYPERELVQVPARQVYYEPVRPLAPVADTGLSAQQAHDDVLHLEDVSGKRFIATRLRRTVRVSEAHSTTALEVMSRFAVDPKWINYLPPTMSPSQTSRRDGLLEHPAEAFAYYLDKGVSTVICQEKHMGSRAVVQLCRDADAARRRFGVSGDETGMCYTRTGRRFFNDPVMERAFLTRLRTAVEGAGLWARLRTDWLTLDAELMPWSLKAAELVRRQYAAVGAAGQGMMPAVCDALAAAAARGVPVDDLRRQADARKSDLERFTAAYQGYLWPVNGVDDLRLAPFHLLASEGAVHTDKDHAWHMATLSALAEQGDPIIRATAHRVVDLYDDTAVQAAIDWWDALTTDGGEGLVIKPMHWLAEHKGSWVQPAVKCRGPEYLRIIYGPEYRQPQHLERLRQRGLGAKRERALNEYVLGLEGLYRFVDGEPLRRVHECVFAVLALESEPADPRL